jgi:hypothetical protein
MPSRGRRSRGTRALRTSLRSSFAIILVARGWIDRWIAWTATRPHSSSAAPSRSRTPAAMASRRPLLNCVASLATDGRSWQRGSGSTSYWNVASPSRISVLRSCSSWRRRCRSLPHRPPRESSPCSPRDRGSRSGPPRVLWAVRSGPSAPSVGPCWSYRRNAPPRRSRDHRGTATRHHRTAHRRSDGRARAARDDRLLVERE